MNQDQAEVLRQLLPESAALGALLKELQQEAEARALRLVSMDLTQPEAIKLQAEIKGQLHSIDRIKELINERSEPR